MCIFRPVEYNKPSLLTLIKIKWYKNISGTMAYLRYQRVKITYLWLLLNKIISQQQFAVWINSDQVKARIWTGFDRLIYKKIELRCYPSKEAAILHTYVIYNIRLVTYSISFPILNRKNCYIIEKSFYNFN